jgi:hypothetical protein
VKPHLVCGYAKPPGEALEWKFTSIPTNLVLDVYLVNRGLMLKLLGKATFQKIKKTALQKLKFDGRVHRCTSMIG